MLAMSDRERPCSARISPSSLGLVTVMMPSACFTSIGAVTSRLSSPFGPLTWTLRPSMVTLTPAGTTTGSRPIRDIAGSLPDVGEDARQVVLARVHPQAGLGHALESPDGTLPGRPELQRDHQVLAHLGVLHL